MFLNKQTSRILFLQNIELKTKSQDLEQRLREAQAHYNELETDYEQLSEKHDAALKEMKLAKQSSDEQIAQMRSASESLELEQMDVIRQLR